MSESVSDRLTNTINDLLWHSLIEKALIAWQPLFNIPILGSIVRKCIDDLVIIPILRLAVQSGITLYVNWKTLEEYKSYRDAAVKLIELGDSKDEHERIKEFREAAKNLILIKPLS